MPPVVGQQNAAKKYRSPIASGSGSASLSVDGSVRQSSGYPTSAHRGSNAAGHGTYASSYHAHPSPDVALPRQYGSPYTSNENTAGVSMTSGVYSLPLQLGSSASQIQSSLSQSGYGSQRLNQAPSHTYGSSSTRFEYRPDASSSSQTQVHTSSGTQRPSQSHTTITPSRFGYSEKPKQSSSQPTTASPSNNHGYSPKDIPPESRAAFRGGANMAHPSHYRQSNLQYSSTPNRAPQSSPTSSFQVVVGTSTPAQFYKKIPLPSYKSESGSTSTPRRGRPPKNSLLGERSLSATPKKRGHPSTKNQLDAKTPKKRGRPSRTAEATLEAAVRKAARASTSGMPKKKGRPLKIRHQVDIKQPEPVFYPFICEWKDCGRELHNLETLRLHISIVHKKRVDGKVSCLWRDCSVEKYADEENGGEKGESGESSETEVVAAVENAEKETKTTQKGDKKTKAARMQFRSRQEWKQHIEEKHLIPFAWHMGDGPKGTDLSGKPKNVINPLWLTDSSGTQVTPSVAKQPLEDGRASKNNAKRFRKMRGSEEYAIKGAVKTSQQLRMGGGMGMAPPSLVGGSSEDEDEGDGDGDGEEAAEEVDMLLVGRGGSEAEGSDEDADRDKHEGRNDGRLVQMCR